MLKGEPADEGAAAAVGAISAFAAATWTGAGSAEISGGDGAGLAAT